jgi:CRP-like cAMP-binding protein
MLETPRMAVLRRVTALRWLSRDDLVTLAAAADEVAVPAGSVVQHHGQSSPHVAVVLDGTAGLWDGGEQVGAVGPGDVVANRPPLDVLTRSARVVAQTPMRLLALPAHLVAEKLDDTAVTAAMVQSLVTRLRRPDGSGSSGS